MNDDILNLANHSWEVIFFDTIPYNYVFLSGEVTDFASK